MNIEQRRSLSDNCLNNEMKFHPCCRDNYWSANIAEREPFESEVLYTSVGTREILAIFKAGESNTPRDRAFDIYLPKDIKSGIYPLNIPTRLIQIAFTENFPAYTTYWATEGVVDLQVSPDAQVFSGSFEIKFKDRQNRECASDGKFAFSLDQR